MRRDDQVVGLAHLLTLALRVLTLFELLVRRGQEQHGEKLPGLYPGQASRTTDRPDGVAGAGGDRAGGDHGDPGRTMGDERRWHLTPLPQLLRRVLAYLGLPETVYTRLVINSS